MARSGSTLRPDRVESVSGGIRPVGHGRQHAADARPGSRCHRPSSKWRSPRPIFSGAIPTAYPARWHSFGSTAFRSPSRFRHRLRLADPSEAGPSTTSRSTAASCGTWNRIPTTKAIIAAVISRRSLQLAITAEGGDARASAPSAGTGLRSRSGLSLCQADGGRSVPELLGRWNSMLVKPRSERNAKLLIG